MWIDPATAPNSLIALKLDTDWLGPKGEGRFDGLPILLKDNIETRDMPTTAGSLGPGRQCAGS